MLAVQLPVLSLESAWRSSVKPKSLESLKGSMGRAKLSKEHWTDLHKGWAQGTPKKENK